jgi:hypothetical protein
LKEELQTNWPILALLGSLFLILARAGYLTPEFIDKANSLVLSVATLFLTVFIMFTVSQNIDSIKNIQLFKEGAIHRFLRADRYVSRLALWSLLLSFVNDLPVFAQISFVVFRKNYLVDLQSLRPIFLFASLILIVDSFLALIGYYFTRVELIFETELSKKLLDDEWASNNHSSK